MPYSEGMYEDISKIQFAGYYWEPDRAWEDIYAEYANYEFSSEVIDDVLKLASCIEKNHVIVGESKSDPDYAASDEGAELAESIQERLGERAKKSWRWRILYIRAITDKKRYDYYKKNLVGSPYASTDIRHFGGDFLADDEEAQNLLRELRGYYHSVEFNGLNQFTLPVVGGNTHVGHSGTYADALKQRGLTK